MSATRASLTTREGACAPRKVLVSRRQLTRIVLGKIMRESLQMNHRIFFNLLLVALLAGSMGGRAAELRWQHLSSSTGDLPVPGTSTQQTGALVADLANDGVNGFRAQLSPGGAGFGLVSAQALTVGIATSLNPIS